MQNITYTLKDKDQLFDMPNDELRGALGVIRAEKRSLELTAARYGINTAHVITTIEELKELEEWVAGLLH
jgi:hypothetical protein